MAKGISGSGQGFDAPAAGKVGGRFVGRDVGPHQRRELALRAAQERLKKQALMPAGPRKLGALGGRAGPLAGAVREPLSAGSSVAAG